MSFFNPTRATLWTTPFFVLACLVGQSAQAVDLGRYGPVYEIKEPDFIEEMTAKAARAVADGTWKKIEDETKQRVLKTLKNPPPVAGLTPVQTPRAWLHDPSIVLSQAIVDADGHVLFPAGTRVNPLDVVTLNEPLLFFDGRDPQQRAWAQKIETRYDGAITPILTAGSWQDLSVQRNRPVYYDQRGTLTRQLGIRAVPALVTQEGKHLRIEEQRP